MGNWHSSIRLPPPDQPGDRQAPPSRPGSSTNSSPSPSRYNLRSRMTRAAQTLRRNSDSEASIGSSSRSSSRQSSRSRRSRRQSSQENVPENTRLRNESQHTQPPRSSGLRRRRPFEDLQNVFALPEPSSPGVEQDRRRLRLSAEDVTAESTPNQNAESTEPQANDFVSAVLGTDGSVTGFIPFTLPQSPGDAPIAPDDSRYFFLAFAPMGSEPSPSTTEPPADPEPRSSRFHSFGNFIRTTIGSHFPSLLGQSASEPAPTDQQSLQTAPAVIIRLSRVPSETEGPNGTPVSGYIFQWTVYIMIRNNNADGSDGGNQIRQPVGTAQLNPQQRMLVERAIAFIRTMAAIGSMPLDGTDDSYERLLRLQELLGVVERGVTKDLIDAQCPDFAVDPLLHFPLSCPICLDPYAETERMRTLPCTHSYHMLCIDKWLSSRNSCPICRQEPIKRPPSQPSASESAAS